MFVLSALTKAIEYPAEDPIDRLKVNMVIWGFRLFDNITRLPRIYTLNFSRNSLC